MAWISCWLENGEIWWWSTTTMTMNDVPLAHRRYHFPPWPSSGVPLQPPSAWSMLSCWQYLASMCSCSHVDQSLLPHTLSHCNLTQQKTRITSEPNAPNQLLSTYCKMNFRMICVSLCMAQQNARNALSSIWYGWCKYRQVNNVCASEWPSSHDTKHA